MDDRNKKLIAIGGAVGSVAICCVAAVLVFMIADPFGWFGRLFGGDDPIADAMPRDTDLYVSLNMAKLLSADAGAVIETIIESIPSAGTADMEDMIDEMIDDIFSGYGLTFSSDIQPWLGQYIGLSMANFTIDSFGDVSEPEMVFGIEVRDRDAADDFIADFTDARERDQDASYSSSEYRGATIYELKGRYTAEAIARSGSVLFFGSSAYAVENAIDAQKGDSLADEAAYSHIASQLPNQRFATFYMSSSFLESSGDLTDIIGGGASSPIIEMQSMAMTLAFTDIGLQLDLFLGIDEDQMDEAQLDLLDSARPSGDLISILPEETIAFFTGQGLDLIWEAVEEIMEMTYGSDFREAMRFFDDAYGFRPDLDLFPILDGEWALALFAGSNSELAYELGGLGVMLVAESSQEDDLAVLVDTVASSLERSGMDIRDRSVDGSHMYIAERRGAEVFSFAAQSSILLVGSDSAIMLDTMEGASSIEDVEAYGEIWNAFPRGTTPALYIDLRSLLETLVDLDFIDWEDLAWEIGLDPRPFTHLAVGSGGLKRDVMRATLIIFVDTD
jgi:hypothetical protein